MNDLLICVSRLGLSPVTIKLHLCGALTRKEVEAGRTLLIASPRDRPGREKQKTSRAGWPGITLPDHMNRELFIISSVSGSGNEQQRLAEWFVFITFVPDQHSITPVFQELSK
ncbi:hypothetical protein WG66_001080 [Moniliophthora roreri]|nr:hypothetical protein WG66_001080 [Moniliophthora roreri]